MWKKGFKTVIFITFLVLSVLIGLEKVRAGTEHNISGWAWSENIGWISFNNLSGGGGVSYGVDVDEETGYLSGHAWSENIGWISFERDETGVPPAGDPCPGGGCIAKIEDMSCPGDECLISGWGRALAAQDPGGWDGWISFDDLSANDFYQSLVDVSSPPSEFVDWAWGGNETNGDWRRKAVVGWVSQNCSNKGACGTSPYNVVVDFSPVASDLQVTQDIYCEVFQPPVFLIWTFDDPDGGSQTAYRVQVDTDSSFATPVDDSGRVNSSSTVYTPDLDWSTTYYWRVKVWDDEGNASDWVVDSSTFTTESGAIYPDFSWDPSSPVIGEEVQFTDESSTVGTLTISSWSWTFEDGNPPSSSDQNPICQFTATDAGGNDVWFQASGGGIDCSVTKTVSPTLKIPEWEEVAPE